MRLWAGRIGKPLDDSVDHLNRSLHYDLRLSQEDIDVSKAWATGLVGAGVLSNEEGRALRKGLEEVRGIFDQGKFEPLPTDEDIHTAVERLLVETVGTLGEKIHTGRSRNDQVATSFRLWVLRACDRVREAIEAYAEAVLECARGELETLMPGYTHLQHAQPVTWSHWLLAHFWAIMRDRERFQRTKDAAGWMPLGSGALAGTPYDIDRKALARELGFTEISRNSIDAVSDRDFLLEFLFAASALGIHLSRFGETLILFSTSEFGFVELDDAYVTGSSLMPQKKNPDVLELARGKSGRLTGNLAGLLSTLKGLPSAYDKDLQEDKEPVFDSYDTLMAILPAMAGLMGSLTIRPDRMRAGIKPASLATDVADYLVLKGITFREAHQVVGRIVREAESRGAPISELPLEFLQQQHDAFDVDVKEVFDLESAVRRRAVIGGTAPKSVLDQIQRAVQLLGSRE